MLSRQNIWFQVALAIVTFLLLWFLGSGRVEASFTITEPYGSAVYNYNGTSVTYFYVDNFSYFQSSSLDSSSYMKAKVDMPCYLVITKDYMFLFSYDSFVFQTYNEASNRTTSYNSYAYNGLYYYDMFTTLAQASTGYSCASSVITSDAGKFRDSFMDYMKSDSFIEIKLPVFVQTLKSTNDNTFKLFNVKGYVENNVFQASWTVPFGVGEDSVDMPLLVDFAVTDVDNNIVSVIQYPSSSLPDSPLGTRV